MPTPLILVSFAALALGGVLAVVGGKLLLSDRKRSDARVAALAFEALGEDFVGPPPDAPRFTSLDDDERPHEITGDLFSAAPSDQRAGHRMWLAAAMIGIFVMAAGAIAVNARNSRTATRALPPAARVIPPIELRTLSHRSAEDGAFTVTGSVASPSESASSSELTALIYLFDRSDRLVASAQARLDTLAPGADAPFSVTIRTSADVGRFRVAFRAADGTILPQLDRRDADTEVQR